MLSFFRMHLLSVQGRIIAGFALITAVVVGHWPDHVRTFDPVRAGAIVTAAVAWLFSELADTSTIAASEHDLRLFRKFQETLRQIDKDFLRDQDFGFSFVYSHTEGLRELSYWNGAAYEFVDRKIENQWNPLLQAVQNFTSLIARYSIPMSSNILLGTVHPTRGDPDFPEAWVVRHMEELNETASALHRQLNDFERFARRRLKL